MNADELLRHFEQVADAPDAVPQLRRFVLDLAVRGKLVSQDAADSPASNLLTRIAAERALLGISSAAVPMEAGDMPFPLPSGWSWSRIGEVCSKTGSGSTPRGGQAAYRQAGIPFLRSQNVYDDGLRLQDVAFIDTDTHARMAGTQVRPKDLLLNITGGSIGRCCRVPDDFGEANVSQHVAILRLAVPAMSDYLHVLVLSPYFQRFVDVEQTGAGRGGLPKGRMDQIAVSVPPLAEQHRIVAKVDELMALCDRLEAARAERETARDRLAAVTLARLSKSDPETFAGDARFALDALPAISTASSQVVALRQTILNLAVSGKLVSQEAADQTGADLLARIAEERSRLVDAGSIPRPKPAKRDNSRPPVRLPASWAPAALGELCSLVTSGSRGWGEYYADEGPGFVRAQNIRFGLLRLDDLARVNPPNKSEGSRTQVAAGDLLVVITGAGVTNPALLDRDIGEAYVSQHVALVRPVDADLSKWLLLCLMAPSGGRAELIERAYGSGKPGLNLDNLRRLSVPIPPLAEQKRIVAKVQELLALCNQLEVGLNTAMESRSRLLEAVLHGALESVDRVGEVAT
jgi:type I restriction enzyme S subunit